MAATAVLLALQVALVLSEYAEPLVLGEQWQKQKPGWSQRGAAVNLPGGRWTNDAQDAFFDGSRLCARLRQPDTSFKTRCTHVIADQTFRVSAAGDFEPDGASEMLYDEYVRIDYPTDTVPGSWQQSSRNSKLQGSILETELQREDGTWVQTITSVLHWHFLENIDGTFYIQRAPCASLGVCVYSYVLKLDAKDLYCTRAVCDPIKDRDQCCDRVESCAAMTTCDRSQSLVPDLNGWCRDRACDQILDQDICCVPAAFCDGMQCLPGYVLKLNAHEIQCPQSMCFPEGDRDLCCEQQGVCSDLPYSSADCPVGKWFNSDSLCAQRQCNNVTDLGICCQPAMRCDLGLNCSHGFVPKADYEQIYCLAPECSETDHLLVCCDAAAPCSDINCGHGYYQLSDTYCGSTECNVTEDFSHCCLRSAECSTLQDQSCPYGYWFDHDERCLRDPCDSNDRSTALNLCCKPSEPCSSLTCLHGFVYKTTYLSLTCLLDECNMTTDLGRCCDVAAHCDTLSCGHGFTPDPLANDTYCPATSCDINRDRDLCCEAAPECAVAFTCPHGYTSWPDTYCDGVVCDDTRDRDICCRPAMPCTAVACPTNYDPQRIVTRFDTYCRGVTCEIVRDLDWCCERGMALMYYRFLPTDLRLAGYTVVQMSDFYLYNQQIVVEGFDQAIFYCDPCDTPVNGREDPVNLGDGNSETKWLDYSRNGFYVKLPAAQPIFSYSFITGNDEAIRDPILWQLWGSPNDVDWVILHEITDRTLGESIVPTARATSTLQVSIEVPCFAPTASHIDNAANVTCEEGDLLRHNTNCTPVCQDGFTPNIDAILCQNGELTPDIFSCA